MTSQQPQDAVNLLAPIAGVRLGRIPAAAAAKIVRRIVDREALVPRLDVAAFNSAP